MAKPVGQFLVLISLTLLITYTNPYTNQIHLKYFPYLASWFLFYHIGCSFWVPFTGCFFLSFSVQVPQDLVHRPCLFSMSPLRWSLPSLIWKTPRFIFPAWMSPHLAEASMYKSKKDLQMSMFKTKLLIFTLTPKLFLLIPSHHPFSCSGHKFWFILDSSLLSHISHPIYRSYKCMIEYYC